MLLVAQNVGATLREADPIVQALDEAESDLVLGLALGGDTFPVPVDHRGEVFVGFQPSPIELFAPVLEDLPRPGFAAVVPELAEAVKLETVSAPESVTANDAQQVLGLFMSSVIENEFSRAPKGLPMITAQ